MKSLLRDTVPADIHVGGVHEDDRILFRQLPVMERQHLSLNSLRNARDCRGRVVLSVQFLYELGDLTGRDALLVEKDDRVFKVLAPPRIGREQALLKVTVPVSRNTDVKDSVLRVKVPFVAAVPAVAGTVALGPVLLVAEECGEFCLEDSVDRFLSIPATIPSLRRS